MFAFVLGLAFLLLLVTFRSIVIPIKAIVLNLLSVGAAYGVLVLVFQHGPARSCSASRPPARRAWLPLFLFVILFGLSMDYHVFILSRIREAFDRGMTTEDAVAHGIKLDRRHGHERGDRDGRRVRHLRDAVVIVFKQLGIGLAVAILIDATLVRAVLLPGDDEAARRPQLVPAEEARLAAAARARAGGGSCGRSP